MQATASTLAARTFGGARYTAPRTSRRTVRPAQAIPMADRLLLILADITQMADTTSSSYGSRAELSRWMNPEVLKAEGADPVVQVIVILAFVGLTVILPTMYYTVGELFTDEVYDERVGGSNRMKGMLLQRTKLERQTMKDEQKTPESPAPGN